MGCGGVKRGEDSGGQRVRWTGSNKREEEERRVKTKREIFKYGFKFLLYLKKKIISFVTF